MNAISQYNKMSFALLSLNFKVQMIYLIDQHVKKKYVRLQLLVFCLKQKSSVVPLHSTLVNSISELNYVADSKIV